MITDPDNLRTDRLPEGDVFINILNFPECQRPPPSLGINPRPAVALKTSSNRPSPATVAHRPWEDSIPCGPRWPSDYYCEGMTDRFPGKPKTFKPVLLYHRPEEPELPYLPRFRPFCSHVSPFHACENDGEDCCSFHCHEDVEEQMRDLLHSAIVHDHLYRTGHDVYDPGYNDCLEWNCSCGLQNPLGHARTHCWNARKHSTVNGCSLQRPERTAEQFRRHCHGPCHSFSNDPFSYPFPPFPPLFPQNSLTSSPQFPYPVSPRTQSQSAAHKTSGHSIINRTQHSVSEPPVRPLHPALTSFPLPLQNRFPATRAASRPHIPVFARQTQTTDRDSATEIRRALLNNHPVFDNNMDHASSNKREKPDDIQNTALNNNHTRACTGEIHSNKNMDQDREQNSSSSSCVFNVNSDLTQAVGQCSPDSAMIPSGTRPGSTLSTLSQISPVSSLVSDGTADGWQEWAGRYGGFLQFLNSPDSPHPLGISSEPPASCVPETASRPTTIRPAGFVDTSDTVEQTTQWGQDTSQGTEGAINSEDDKDSKRHKCPYCDVTCTNNGQLKGHLRVHTGERPYRCECGRAFARNEELTRHRRIHSGLRPHVCTICGKRFGRKDHLNKHQKTHLRTSEKKTHVCQVAGCQQRYTRSDALARHQWGAHGIKAKSSRIRPLLQGQGHDPAMTQVPARSPEEGSPDLLPFALLS